MPKKGHSKKRTSRRAKPSQKRQIKSSPSGIFTIFVLAFVLALIVFCIFFFNDRQSENIVYNLSTKIPFSKSAIRNVSLITPYPTITVTPTPVPLTGYCLHVPVLMYHHVQPESVAKDLGQTSLTVDSGVFDQQMAYLKTQGYNSIWADELVNALITHSGLPGRSIMVTMDDGYADNDTYALPVLKKYGMKANLMLASGLVGANSDMLSWGQVNDMKGSGLIYITNHTWSHWPVTRGPQSKIESEIDTAQTQIQQYTGQTVNIFTYPYGGFDNNSIATLQRKGYIGALSEIPGQYQCDSFIMSLHRTRIGNGSLAAYGI